MELVVLAKKATDAIKVRVSVPEGVKTYSHHGVLYMRTNIKGIAPYPVFVAVPEGHALFAADINRETQEVQDEEDSQICP